MNHFPDNTQDRTDFHTTTLSSPADGLGLSVSCLTPREGIRPKGIIQLVHGMCEHKERYFPFMEYMADKGYVCVIHDHRGHGASVSHPSELGYFHEGGYEAMIEDAKAVTDWAAERFPGLEINLFGHSMGSMVVRAYAKRYDNTLTRLIVCGSPSYDPASKIGMLLARHSMKRKGGRHRPQSIQRLSFNSFNRKFRKEGSPNAWVCSDKNVVAAYDKDPLCNFQFTSNGFYNLFSLMQYAYSAENWAMRNTGMPVLFISGADDPCLINEKKFAGTVKFMRDLGYKNVTSRLYPGMRHEILNETGKIKVWEDIVKFLS